MDRWLREWVDGDIKKNHSYTHEEKWWKRIFYWWKPSSLPLYEKKKR